MDKPMDYRAFRSVPEMKYVNADNFVRYRTIMRFFYQEYKRLRYWMKPEDIYAGVAGDEELSGYTLDLCVSDLEQLEQWGNLASRHDGGRASTLDEYMKKKMQYLMRPYSIEIERLLETLEKVTGYGGSLESTLFDSIAEKLFAIRRMDWDSSPGAALELWTSLYEAFKKLHENAADYIASLQTARAEEMMVAESFLVFKDRLTNYLQNFVQALQRSAYKIEGNLERINAGVRDLFLDRVAAEDLDKPRMEEAPSKESLLAELEQGWSNLQRWFLGDGLAPSELTLLERSTKDAIARIVRSVIRMQERKRSGVSRKKELDYLGRWFAGLEKLEDAHQLAGLAFGLFQTRHLQGEDLRTSDRADQSMWDEVPTLRNLRSRSRKRGAKQDSDPIPDNEERKQREREAYMRRQAEEWEAIRALVGSGTLRISDLGRIDSRTRIRLLQWIGRCNSAPKHTFVTPEGVRIAMKNAKTEVRTILRAVDGELHLPDYEFEFALTDAAREAAATAEMKAEARTDAGAVGAAGVDGAAGTEGGSSS
ncbi:TIGR02677 family protein [Cohnella fermenti]|uniref:TIGR02677 family protein n=1 Tax=Cohnella fermenti TaxID=2565925 RepID=A0A4S4BGM7_9BACL|nr:TIGR02677 family protein [Cohnella fermenti]THF73609.1 TIGR02677 family protein [Cohnella fermenti]